MLRRSHEWKRIIIPVYVLLVRMLFTGYNHHKKIKGKQRKGGIYGEGKDL